ncbi:MAG TPA: Crp/Fnr family transcriptional regulator, partial [Candidatus Acidoferrum sp.]|nr:Crp/Fnr family transcriptional regulator [Candidatus Acidoferrum sp.]
MNLASRTPQSSMPRAGRGSAHLTAAIDRMAPSSAPATRMELAVTAMVRTFARGEIVTRQGERETVGVLMDGVAAAQRTTSDGRAVVPFILGHGSVIGGMALAGHEALFDIVALAPCSAAFWAGSKLRALAAGDPGLALGLVDMTLNRFNELTLRLDSLHYQDARGRVARVLYEHRDLCFGDRPTIGRTELSKLVGTSAEMTRRVVSRLVREGTIGRVGMTGLELRDDRRLRELAGVRPA